MSAALTARLTRAPLGAGPGLDGLLAAMADASPFLAGLLARHGAWMHEAAEDPEAAARALHAAARTADASELRALAGRHALLVAACDLGGAWDLGEATAALTAFADAATQGALGAALEREAARGALEAPGEGRLFALAMGKMGASELNYASDIDLILLFDRAGLGGRYPQVRAALVRAVRAACRVLSEPTEGGMVLRTDLRLRPDPSVTPVAMPTDAALDYYQHAGRGWERAAHIKARAAAGDVPAGRAYLKDLAPFVWRRSLDYRALSEAMGLLGQIQNRSAQVADARGADLKRGRGGIRQIEFAAQALQLVHGGRDPSLRAPDTRGALAALARAGHLSEEVARTLCAAYVALREAEHRVQMLRGAQTHTVPTGPDLAHAAALAGQAPEDWIAHLTRTLADVERATEALRPREAPAPCTVPKGWLGAPALRSAAAREGLARISAPLMARVEATARPEATAAAIERFLANLPAGAQILALFDASPALMDLVVEVAAAAPDLAAHLARHPGALDAVVSGEAFAPWPEIDALTEALAAETGRAEGYEAALVALRRAAAERRFAAGLGLLRGTLDAAEAGRRHAALAEAVLRTALPLVLSETARRHGPPPGGAPLVLGMGSLGAGRLDPGSDLDLIVVFDAAPGAVSEGPKPLEAPRWHAKATQTLVTALSAPMAGGVLYEVDLRLRPSGRRGPVAVSATAFERYQREEAWVWERLALTRARAVAGPAALAARIETLRRDVIGATGTAGDAGAPREVAAGLVEMRERLAAARPGGAWNLRDGPGGLRDVELAAQAATLIAGGPERATPDQLGHWGEGAGDLARAWRIAADGRMAMRLMAPSGAPEGGWEALGTPGHEVLARLAGLPEGASLPDAAAEARAAAAARIDAALARWAG